MELAKASASAFTKRPIGIHLRMLCMMILDGARWFIDTIGKLGPLFVAIAVYEANKRQNKWASSAVVRTANLEDQKMRLALLDRRWAVISHLRKAGDNAGPRMKGGEAFSAALDALREAALIFEDEEQAAIRNCLHTIIRYQTEYGSIFEQLTGEDQLEAVVAHQACHAEINGVITRLRDAARVTALPPLAPPD